MQICTTILLIILLHGTEVRGNGVIQQEAKIVAKFISDLLNAILRWLMNLFLRLRGSIKPQPTENIPGTLPNTGSEPESSLQDNANEKKNSLQKPVLYKLDTSGSFTPLLDKPDIFSSPLDIIDTSQPTSEFDKPDNSKFDNGISTVKFSDQNPNTYRDESGSTELPGKEKKSKLELSIMQPNILPSDPQVKLNYRPRRFKSRIE